MEKFGFIKEVKGDKVHIETYPTSTCKHCTICDVKQDIWVDKKYVIDDIKKDEDVVIEYENKFSFLIFLVYILPLIFLVLGYIMGYGIFKKEGVGVIVAFVLFGISFPIIKRVGRKMSKNIMPRVKRS